MTTPVLTQRFDNTRSGCYVDPTWTLTSSQVQAKGIRVLARIKLDDARGTEGQVLGVANLMMRDGVMHNVVYLCDMSNRVYCIDADTYQEMWKQVVGRPVNLAQYGKKYDAWQLNPTWGILSTPVINLATGVLYCVSASSVDGSMGSITYRMHSLSLRDGADVAPPLVLDGAAFQAVGSPVSRLGDVPRKQRPALTLVNGVVFIAFGSFMESASTNVGLVLAIDVSRETAPRIDAVCSTGGSKYPSAGIWQAGAGLSVDNSGVLHALTGNGAFDPLNGYFGNCFTRLKYKPGSLTCIDWWSPYTDAATNGDTDPTRVTALTEAPEDMDPDFVWATNAANGPSNTHPVGDEDLGSGGALLRLRSQTGYGKNVVIGGGKYGLFHTLDADNLGKTLPADFAPSKIAGNWAKQLGPTIAATYPGVGLDLMPTQIDTLPSAWGGYTRHIHGQPVGYTSPDHGELIYVQGENGPVKVYQLGPDYRLTWLADGQEIASQGMPPPGGMPGGGLVLSMQHEADNTSVLWATMPLNGDANKYVTPGRLIGYAANWINEANGQRTLIKVWDSANWGINYMSPKFNIPTPFLNKLWQPSYDGTLLALGQ